ncbi:MAG: APC family permease [Alphaproteobacteria bacterium]
MPLRRIIFGSPLSTASLESERLGKLRALAVFSSDALSSVAYATEEILLVLVLAGSAAMSLSLPIAGVISALIIVLTISYWQTIHAYPSGGGAFVVAQDNLGETSGLVAAAALLIDYVLTVAVSISAGVRAITSVVPSLMPYNITLCLIGVVGLTWANLRGVRESAGLLAIPTYAFIASILLMIGVGFYGLVSGSLSVSSPATVMPGNGVDFNVLGALLVLRAFSSGCSALTGIEAVSNGVPAFMSPSSRNASITLVIMSALLGIMFVGITILAKTMDIVPHEEESVISQVAHGVFGNGLMYYVVQATSALILLLAANTSFAGFPRLASVLAENGYLPRQLANLGDRLAFSNGIVALAILAALIIVLFRGDTHALVPLYSVGVFLSFTLSQAGMVRRWNRIQGPGWEAKAFINGLGAVVTAIALVVIVESKFFDGAWIVLVLIPIGLYMFRAIRRHYDTLRNELSLRVGGIGQWQRRLAKAEPKVVVPLSRLHRGTLAALHFARTLSADVTPVVINLDPRSTAGLQLAWKALGIPEPLVVLESPYRSIISPLMEYIVKVDQRDPERGAAVIVLPVFIPKKWWHHVLHNQSALMLKAALMFDDVPEGKTRIVVEVPIHLPN